MGTQRNDMVLLSEGCYSDYQNNAFKVVKPFTMGEMLEKFRAQLPASLDGGYAPYTPDSGPSDFIAFLIQEGCIEDADIPEVHCGDYGETNLSADVLQFQFEPSKEPA